MCLYTCMCAHALMNRHECERKREGKYKADGIKY